MGVSSRKKLGSITMPRIIETQAENESMLKIVEKLMDKGEGLSPEEEKLLKLLAKLVEDFEERYYHPRDATPLEVLQHLMESRDVKQTHLWEAFGSKGIASEVLNGKRGISKTHARGLSRLLPRAGRFVHLVSIDTVVFGT